MTAKGPTADFRFGRNAPLAVIAPIYKVAIFSR
jgi:hypothetical protein